MADELLTLFGIDQATALVALPVDHNANGGKDSSRDSELQLPLAPAEDQDQELIAALLETLEIGRASTAVPLKAEPPRAVETGEEQERRFGSIPSRITDVHRSKRNKRNQTPHRRPQDGTRRKRRIGRRGGRVGGSTAHHRQQQLHGNTKRCSSSSRFSASDRAESRSAAAQAATLRRHPHGSGHLRATHEDPGSHGAVMRATGRGPQSAASSASAGGCGRCCSGGGCCGACPCVSSAGRVESPPRRGSCNCLDISVLRRRARGVLVTAAVLAPLSITVTGRERRWPLVLLFAPLVHGLVVWVGVAVRASDRCVLRR